MKIACLIGGLHLGGAEKQLIGLAAALSREGHDVEVVTYHASRFYEEDIQRLGLRHVIIRKYSELQIILSLAAYMKRSGCELLISFLASTNMKACLAHAVWPKFKLVVSERNFSIKAGIHDRFRFLLYRQAERIVCNNYSQEEFIRSVFPSASARLTTIPNFVDTTLYHPAAEHRQGEETKIITTARICSRKNALGLIEAASLLKGKGIRFDWYGLVEEDSYYRKCMRRIAELGIGDIFSFHQADHDVAPLYRNADIFCLPSFYEGTSNSLAEALASGLPAAVSAVSDNPRYVREGVNGALFKPSLSASIADAVLRLASLPLPERSAYGLKGRETVCTALSPDAFAKGWNGLVKDLL
jgi:glycosyltransferase involved in cell wall biosynthesis